MGYQQPFKFSNGKSPFTKKAEPRRTIGPGKNFNKANFDRLFL